MLNEEILRGYVKKLVLAVCFFVFIFPGCNKEDKKNDAEARKDKMEFKVEEPPYDTSLPGKEGIENTIKAYNTVLAKLHVADPYYPVLRKYATNKEVQRVFVEERSDTDRGIAMRTLLKNLAFGNISAGGEQGAAYTSEKWEFEYVDIKTKKVVQPKSHVSYELKYKLVREDGRWVVSEIREVKPRVFSR